MDNLLNYDNTFIIRWSLGTIRSYQVRRLRLQMGSSGVDYILASHQKVQEWIRGKAECVQRIACFHGKSSFIQSGFCFRVDVDFVFAEEMCKWRNRLLGWDLNPYLDIQIFGYIKTSNICMLGHRFYTQATCFTLMKPEDSFCQRLRS